MSTFLRHFASLSCILLLQCVQHSTCGYYLDQHVYFGCYVDSANRDITGLAGISKIGPYPVTPDSHLNNFTSMTPHFCANICALGGFPYSAIQAGFACFCGLTYGSQGKAEESSCNSACTGNSSLICGGPWRNSVYALSYIYDYPKGNNGSCTKFRPEPLPVLRVQSFVPNSGYAYKTYKTDLVTCSLLCKADSYQAVMFSKLQQTCYLLKFLLLPEEISVADGVMLVRY